MNTPTVLARSIPLVWLTCIAWNTVWVIASDAYQRNFFKAEFLLASRDAWAGKE